MIRLMIDGVELPMRRSPKLPPYSASTMRSGSGWRSGEEIVVEIVATEQVDRLFGYWGDIYRCDSFNSTLHRAVLDVDGVAIFGGVVTLQSLSDSDGERYYKVRIRRGGAQWADVAALSKLKDLPIDCTMTMTPLDVEASWNGESVVRMLPVWRDSYKQVATESLTAIQRPMMPHNYYPFISVRSVVQTLAESSGYSIRSDFFDSMLMRRLMFSGCYRRVNYSEAEASMGFKAYRTTSTTKSADGFGRVYAWVPMVGSNCGALVDSVSPNVEDEQGLVRTDAHSNGGCFYFDDGRPVFRPTREIGVAFDIYLHYISDFKITSSRWLTGFDTLGLGFGNEVKVRLQNPYKDMRNRVVGGLNYKLMIFDFVEGASYRLGDGLLTTASAVTSVDMPDDVSPSVALYVKLPSWLDYKPYGGDWALYQGYVEPTGRREVELTIRTPYETLSPSKPKVFNNIYFGGAEPGQQLTLCSGCYLTPIFGGSVGYGEVVKFEDIAHHDFTVEQLLEALVHMFNLSIYTDEATKTIYIEPYDDMFVGEVVDWRDRQVGGATLLEDSSTACFETTLLNYLAQDGAVTRLVGAETKLGEWRFDIASYGTKQGVERRTNPLFMPTASYSGVYDMAPSAELLTVGDRDVIDNGDNIEPRVVLYYGLQPLPEGEVWESNEEGCYPFAAFHSPSAEATLCFEDRDLLEGLHRFYDAQLSTEAERERYTCTLHICPSDYVSLFDLDSTGATIRSRFRLAVGGNSSIFRLHSIEDYDLDTHTAKCVFIRTLAD